MAKTVVGLFDDFSTAEQVVRDLQNNGFSRNDISLMARDTKRGYQTAGTTTGTATKSDETHAGEGAAAGAGTGAVLGGLAGLLVGLGALAIPGIGPIIAAGPIATTLAGAGIGAAAGGIVGALVGAGVPEEEADAYAEGVRRGGTLIMVAAPDNMAGKAREVMGRYNPVDIHTRSEMWREKNWSRFDEKGQPYSDADVTRERDLSLSGNMSRTTGTTGSEQGYSGMRRDFNDYSNDFRSNYNSFYGSRGRDFSYYEPGYRYGYDLASNPTYRGRKWNEIEPDVRRDWERNHPGNKWEDFKDAIRHAWDRVSTGGEPNTGFSSTGSTGTTNTGFSSGTGMRRDFNDYSNDFRSNYNSFYGSRGRDFSYYEPGYRYGYDLASNPTYRGRKWNEIEPDVRRDWERNHPGNKWEDFKDAIRHAWDRVTGEADTGYTSRDTGFTDRTR